MAHRLLSSGLDNYYNPNDNYEPTFQVEYGSKLTSDSFDTSMDYLKQSLITSGAVFGAGIICFLFFVFGILLRCCARDCRCLPRRPRKPRPPRQVSAQNGALERNEQADDQAVGGARIADPEERYPWNCGRVFNMVLLVLFALIALGCDQYVLIGRQSISKGVDTTQTAVDDFQGILNSAVNYSEVLTTYGDTLGRQLDAAETSCYVFTVDPTLSATIDGYLEDYDDAVSSVGDSLSPINDDISDYKGRLTLYSSGAILFILWSLGIIAVFLTLFFAFLQKRTESMASLWCVSFTYLVFVILGFVWMFLTIVLGDLCQDPSYNILNASTLSGDTLDIAVYYATCQGNTTITTDLSSATSYVNLFDAKINDALTYCPADVNLLNMQGTVQRINSTLPALVNLTSCEPLQSIWFSLVNDAVCTEFYGGIFYLWGSQLLTSCFLFLMMITASMTYQYFLPMEEMLPPRPLVRRARSSRRNPYNVDDDVFLQANSTASVEYDDVYSDEEDNVGAGEKAGHRV